MPQLQFRCQYDLQYDDKNPRGDEEHLGQSSFSFNINQARVQVQLSWSEGEASVMATTWISDYLNSQLSSGSMDPGDDKAEAELQDIEHLLHSSLRRVLEQMRYNLGWWELRTIPKLKASRDCFAAQIGSEWQPVPPRRFKIQPYGSTRIGLNERLENWITKNIEGGARPFVAWSYLDVARTVEDLRFAWISATIAAELGVKEFLSRLKPEVEPLLLEVPSPPLSKLYGSILNQYTGSPSPYRASLIKGAEVRNKLVHQAATVDLSPVDVITYLNTVELALRELEDRMPADRNPHPTSDLNPALRAFRFHLAWGRSFVGDGLPDVEAGNAVHTTAISEWVIGRLGDDVEKLEELALRLKELAREAEQKSAAETDSGRIA